MILGAEGVLSVSIVFIEVLGRKVSVGSFSMGTDI
jgi:hypothetical protein